jgi:phage tail sheath gpL-like
MTIPFNDIPTALRVPFTYVEFDNSKAQQGPSIQKYTTLAFGQKLAAGSQPVDTPIVVTSEAQARTLFGAGSILHGMLSAYLDNDKVTEVVAVAQDDAGGAVDAAGKITVPAGVLTADGVVVVYIAGRRFPVAVSSGDDQDAVAAAIIVVIQAEPLCYVSAAVNGVNDNEVDLTAKNGGEAGNQIDVRLNFLDTDETPAGLTTPTVTPMAAGATNPDVDDVIGAISETQYQVLIHAYLDATNLGKLEGELADRFGPIRQNDGVAFAAKTDTLGNLTTLGNSRNSAHSSIMGSAGPSAPWEFAAAAGGQVAKSAQADPAKPFQTLPLNGILAPSESEQFTLTERNNLLFDGIATFKVADGGIVRIERMITTFQTNDAGAADDSFLDVNTLLTLSFLRFSFRTRIQTKFSRHKLANDGTRFGPGQQVITPLLGKAEAVALFAEWEDAALVEGVEQFKRDLIVERNQADPNRLDFLLPPDLINQLRVAAASIQFLL